MEKTFERGKYYEYQFDVKDRVSTHAIVMAQEDRKDSLCMVIKSFDNINKEGEHSRWGMEIKPINTFDNIHEVSKRVKELEKEDLKKGDNMCTPQLVQLDCRNESCAFHKDGSCTNNKPALTIIGNKVTCWTERN